MQPVLLVVQFLLAVALIGVILVQRTAQDGGGIMGGSGTMGGLFTARGSANLLTRATAILATLFIINSLTLGYIASSQHQGRSLADQITPVAPVSAPASNTEAPAQSGDPSNGDAQPANAPSKAPAPVEAPAPEVPMAH